MLTVYNDLTKRLEPFQPADPERVTMYTCGVTVYGLSHLGHARCYVAWDVVRRYLVFAGYGVVAVQNFTDIDDKIIKRSKELGEDALALAKRFEIAYFEDMDRLGILHADVYPRATDHVTGMVAFVAQLIQRGHAYATTDGSVYFAVRSFPAYGALSGRGLDDMSQRTRLDEPDPHKKDPADFAIWKGAKEGEPFWESPWGKGRPGWHLECSEMVLEHLGPTIDIHAGGMDLLFPHHENEIAQSEAHNDSQFVRYWLHNGFVNVDKEKMSKSLGNFKTIRDLLEHYDPHDVRYLMLQTHYRQDFDFGDTGLEAAGTALGRLRRSLGEREGALGALSGDVAAAIGAIERTFIEAMDEDFNTPRALAALWDGRSRIAALSDREDVGHLVARIRELGDVLGLNLRMPVATGDPEAEIAPLAGELRGLAASFADSEPLPVESAPPGDVLNWLLARRFRAKKERDFATADAIRKDLAAREFSIADEKTGRTAVMHPRVPGHSWSWTPPTTGTTSEARPGGESFETMV